MQESFWHKLGQNPLSGYWDIVIFMFCAIFSKTTILESQNAKKITTDSYNKHSVTKTDQFQPMGLKILSFSCLCYF